MAPPAPPTSERPKKPPSSSNSSMQNSRSKSSHNRSRSRPHGNNIRDRQGSNKNNNDRPQRGGDDRPQRGADDNRRQRSGDHKSREGRENGEGGRSRQPRRPSIDRQSGEGGRSRQPRGQSRDGDDRRSGEGGRTKQPRSSSNDGMRNSKMEGSRGPRLSKEKEEAVKEFRTKGNVAFEERKWSDAIRFYSQALRVDSRQISSLSNRSAAYLKRGKLNEALDDANACCRMEPKYHKGHLRRGTALFELKRYDEAQHAYADGLKYCPKDRALKEGLNAARAAKIDHSKATKNLRTAEATQAASRSTRNKAKHAASISSFVSETKSNIELEMATLKEQIKFLENLEAMTQEEKLEILFTNLDKDGDGNLDAKELAAALKLKNQDMSLSESIQKAVSLVAKFDDDGNCTLEREEFAKFIAGLVAELNTNVEEFAEFVVFQIIFPEKISSTQGTSAGLSGESGHDKDDGGENKKDLSSMLNDERMVKLFMLFDRDGDRSVSFKEVAMGLYHLTESMEESAKATTSILLMMEENDQRAIGYEQFAKLIMSIVAAAGSAFEDVADDLTRALTSGAEISKECLEQLVVFDKDYNTLRAKERNEKQKKRLITDALSYEKTKRLYHLLDENKDGSLDARELRKGLQRYQDAKEIKKDVKKITYMLLKEDTDGDKELNIEEFGAAIIKYSEICRTDFKELIDFMCVANTISGDKNKTDQYKKGFTKASSEKASRAGRKVPQRPKIRETGVD